jgi:hypothetical protein
MVYLQPTYELCFGEADLEYFEMVIFIGFFLLQTSKSAIHRFCLPMSFRFRKHKGHELAYDVKIMTSQQRLSRIAKSTFL